METGMSKSLDIQATEVFEKTMDAIACPVCHHVMSHKTGCKNAGKPVTKYRVIVNEGGARSSKTVSILQLLIVAAWQGRKLKFDVVREFLPALRTSAMSDFFDILERLGLYVDKNHNKTANTYQLKRTEFNFFGCNEGQKLRGQKRDILFINEANELTKDTFRQLEMRTTGMIFMDYNPSFTEGWIIDLLKRPDVFLIHSTYKDNPFLEQSIIDTIESYEFDDPEYWKIYGLGERGQRTGLIYPKFNVVEEFPPDCDNIGYGLDFGFSPDPKVFVKIGTIGRKLFIDELIYKSELMREELAPMMLALINDNNQIIADSEDPESIEYLKRQGLNVVPVEKGKDSVEFGIETVRGYEINITSRSVNVRRDFSNYKYKMDRNGKTVSPPVPAHSFSHGPDPVRYYAFEKLGKAYKILTRHQLRDTRVEILESVDHTRNY